MTTGIEVNSSGNADVDSDALSQRSETPLDVNIAMHCVLKDNLPRFTKCFEDEEDPFYPKVADMLSERDDNGKTPLEMAAILGRMDILKELLARGAECNQQTKSGYTALHHAACWGKIECLKALVDKGANLQLRTQNGERAREAGERYNQAECVDYLDWAEARQQLVDVITQMQETIADPEKVQGRLARDEKTVALNACKEKNDWIEGTPGATTADFISQKQALDEILAPVWQKLSEPPPEKPDKK